MKSLILCVATILYIFLFVSCARPPRGDIMTTKTTEELDAQISGLIYGLAPGFTDLTFGVAGLKKEGVTRGSIPENLIPKHKWFTYRFPQSMTRSQSIERSAAHYAKNNPEAAVRILIEHGYKWKTLRGKLDSTIHFATIELKDGTSYELCWLPKDWTLQDIGETIEVEGLVSPKSNYSSYELEGFERSFLDLSHLDQVPQLVADAYKSLDPIVLKQSLERIPGTFLEF